MAKANPTQPVPPFPADIDRTAFGHWLSGFTDGEGCFMLRFQKSSKGERVYRAPHPEFRIALRSDDVVVIGLTQSFLGCGRVYYNHNTRSKIANAKPVAIFSVLRVADLANIIIPHFDLFPLRSKKAADFSIWKQGVLLCHAVSMQKRRYTFCLNRSGTRNSIASISPKWYPDQISTFATLKDSLAKNRIFNPTTTLLPST